MFVDSKDHEPNAIVFRANERLLHYDGEAMTKAATDARYGQYTAPYALQTSRTTAIDAALHRGLESFANSKPNKRDGRWFPCTRAFPVRSNLPSNNSLQNVLSSSPSAHPVGGF